MTKKPLLEIKNLHVHYITNEGTVQAINDLTLNCIPVRPWVWSERPEPEKPQQRLL